MISVGKQDAPTPPNPIATAAAQTGTNVSTGVANAFLNNVNQQTPSGNLNYDVTGTYDWTDPATGNSYSIPRFTATQTLNPLQQQTQGEQDATRFNLSQLGTKESQGLLNYLTGSPFSPTTSAPSAASATPLAQVGDPGYTYDMINPLTDYSQFGQAGAIQTSYGNADTLQSRANVENALYARMQPQLDRDRANLESRLADQGIKYGSPAYTAAMDDFNRQLNDARLGIIQQGGQEQQLQENILQNQAQYGLGAQNQAYQQLLGQANLYNTGANQFNQQAATAGAFYNNAQQQELQKQAQVFDAINQQRNQYLTEQYASRNQPLNEVTSLLSGSQLQAPNFINAGQNRIATTDVAGLINNQFNQNLDIYKTQSNNVNSLLGGILGAGGTLGAAYLKSDRRSKKNIHKIGSVMTATPQKLEELPVYKYNYKDDPSSVQHVGPMAQDVEKIDPAAVRKDKRGTKYIDTRRVMGGIMRAA